MTTTYDVELRVRGEVLFRFRIYDEREAEALVKAAPGDLSIHVSRVREVSEPMVGNGP